MLTVEQFARMTDFTAVKASSSMKDVEEVIRLGLKYKCASIGVLPGFIKVAREMIGPKYSEVLLGGNVSYPSGGEKTCIKVMQARDMIASGCEEVDMVINIGYIKSGMYEEAVKDIVAVKEAVDGALLKVIIEVTYLTDDEIRLACDACIEAGADFVKTGTGWSPMPTTLRHVQLITDYVGDRIKVKAAGGIRDLDTVEKMVDMGVQRFGLGVGSIMSIIKEIEARDQK